jgi:hypothetical protein
MGNKLKPIESKPSLLNKPLMGGLKNKLLGNDNKS